MLKAILAISAGASLGALFRYFLGIFYNSIFPLFPLGTLFANLIGGFLMGIFMGLSKGHFFSETARLAITTGFLGGLTTFSTFSAEATNLLAERELIYFSLLIMAHVGGSILAIILGIYFIKLIIWV